MVLAEIEVLPSWIRDLGALGAVAFALVWGARVLIPKALDLVQATIAKLAEDHKIAVQSLVQEFRAEMKATREWATDEFEKRDRAIEWLVAAVERKT